MTDMIERAADAWWTACGSIVGDWPEQLDDTKAIWRSYARAALLAALDMSDDTPAFGRLVAALAHADDGNPEGLKYREQAKAAIVALRTEAGS